MTVQSVNVRFVTSYSGRGTKAFQRDLNTLGGSMQKVSQEAGQSFSRFARFSQAAGTALMVGLGAALAVGIKASIDFESAFAGVRKTVDASEATFQNLATEIRAMALEIPIAATELARIGELGGQLGIPVTALDEFIRVIAELGVTTNLEVDEAATGIARFVNVMGSADDEFDNVGSSLVELGNNFATTESEILNFGSRLSGIGSTVGLSEGDVLGLAAAFTALGEPAERGATAVQRAFTIMFQAVNQGGEDLHAFAEIAGTTAEEFATLFTEDPAEAFVVFAEGLHRIIEEGGDVTTVLQELGLGSQRTLAAMLKAAQGHEELARGIQMGNESFDEASALSEEAAKRFGTVASQLGILKNQFTDLGIEIGDKAMPAFKDALGFVGGFFDILKENLPVLQAFAGMILLLAGAKGLVKLGQIFAGVLTGLGEMSIRMTGVGVAGINMGQRLTRAGTMVSAFGGVLGIAALAIGLVGTAMARNRQHANAYRDSIENLADTVEGFVAGANDMKDVVEAFATVLSQKTGIFDWTVDLEENTGLLHDLGISVNEFTRLALTDTEAFDKRMRQILSGHFGLDEASIDKLIESAFTIGEIPGGLRMGEIFGEGEEAEARIAQFHDFVKLLRETTAATEVLREEEALRRRESQLGFGEMAPQDKDLLDRLKSGNIATIIEGFIGDAEQYEEALANVAEATTEFGDEWIAAWDDIIADVQESLFDWGTALDGFEVTTEANLADMRKSLRNWLKEQGNITGALEAIVAEFGPEAGQFFLTELTPEQQGQFGAAWAQGNVNAMLDTMGQILDARSGLLNESLVRLLSIAPATAGQILDSWATFLDTELIPQLLDEGFIEGSDEFNSALSEQFTALMVQLGENRPELASALTDLLSGAAQDVIANINSIPIGAMSTVVIDEVVAIMESESTTSEKIGMFQAIGFSYAEAVALAFQELPFMLGDTLVDPAAPLREQKLIDGYVEAGKAWARGAMEGFRILPGLMGGVADAAARNVNDHITRRFRIQSPSRVFRYFGEMAAAGFEQGLGPAMNFRPAQPIVTVQVPQQAANGPSITINNPSVREGDLLTSVKRASSLIGLTRAAETTPGFN